MEENKLYMNGQEVTLKNPGTNALKEFLIISKAMGEVPKDAPEEKFMSYFSDESLDAITSFINKTVKKTFGEITEEIDAWAMENAMLILPKAIEMCTPSSVSIEQAKKQKMLERLNGN